MNPRDYLESSIFRHGKIEKISKSIEAGKKPPYEEYIKFMQGEIDPSIDREETGELIQKKIEAGELKKENFDIIICSPALRARQTSGLVKELLGTDAPVHPSEYLREVKISMEDITPEFYEQAKDVHEVRKKFFESLLAGKKVDEDIVDVYKRAERFLTYLQRIKKFTNKKPLFIGHGIFPRFLELAINHQEENLNDDEIRNLIKEEFNKTTTYGTFKGLRIASGRGGSKIISLT